MTARSRAIWVAGVLLATTPAFAQDRVTDLDHTILATTGGDDVGTDAVLPLEVGSAPRDKVGTIDARFVPFARHEDVGDLEHDLGDVEVDRYGGELRFDYTDGCGYVWSTRFAFEESSFDLDDSPIAGGGDVLDEATTWSLSLVHSRDFSAKWAGFCAVGFQFSGADTASSSDAGNVLGGLGAVYTQDEKLSYGLGVLVADDFSAGTRVLPLPIVSWKIDDDSTLTWRGPKLDFAHRGGRGVTLHATVEMEYRAYALGRRAPIADGTVLDEHVLAGVGADWAATDWLTLSVEGGAILRQEYKLRDEDGDRLERLEGDGAGWFLGVAATLRW